MLGEKEGVSDAERKAGKNVKHMSWALSINNVENQGSLKSVDVQMIFT